VVHDDTNDMVGHVAYHYLRAAQLGQPFVTPPELTEEEELVVGVLVSIEVEKRAVPGLDDSLALFVAPPPPPGLPRCSYRGTL
jgi:hypothetical protein